MNPKNEFHRLYKRREWFRFRQKCMALAGWACQRCGKTQNKAPLQIHHPHYTAGLNPWEYDPRFCVVLCKGCHAREHGKIKPLEGWVLVHSDWDHGEPTGPTHCEHCETPMEWHNDLWHPDWGVITVGYDCAEKLGNPEVHEIKRMRERINTFVFSPRWKATAKGTRYKHGDTRVFVMETPSGFVLNINGEWGKRKYMTEESAKEQACRFLHGPHSSRPT